MTRETDCLLEDAQVEIGKLLRENRMLKEKIRIKNELLLQLRKKMEEREIATNN